MLVVVVVRSTLLDDDVSAVPTAEAVDRYRDDITNSTAGSTANSTAGSTVAPRATSLPQPGVYRYLTEGTESIDVLNGATHVYPAETTITVSPSGCGVMLRWDALRERNEEWSLCLDGDHIELQPDGASFHEFFGRQQVEDLRCDRPVVVVPADGEARPPVALRCTLGGRPTLDVWEVLGRSNRLVEGEMLSVQHVRMTVDDTDRYFEQITMDWFLDEHGLPVEIRLVESSLADTAFGDVRYDERYSLTLVSRTPLT